MGKTRVAVLIAVVVTGLSSCRNMYEGFHAQGLERCYTLPYPEQQDCLRQNDVSYEEYEEQRKQQQPLK